MSKFSDCPSSSGRVVDHVMNIIICVVTGDCEKCCILRCGTKQHFRATLINFHHAKQGHIPEDISHLGNEYLSTCKSRGMSWLAELLLFLKDFAMWNLLTQCRMSPEWGCVVWKLTGLLTVLLILLLVLVAFSLEKMEALWAVPEPHNRSQPRRGYSRHRHKWTRWVLGTSHFAVAA
jgi:hypothetical protein